MADISGFPYCEVQFKSDGTIFKDAEVQALIKALGDNGSTDLVAISHGWNNDVNDARNLYQTLFGNVRKLLDTGVGPGLGERKLAVLGVLWPSKKFADPSVIASGAAGINDDSVAGHTAAQLDLLAKALDNPTATTQLQQAKALISQIENGVKQKRQFADLVRGVLPRDAINNAEDASKNFFDLAGEEVFNRLSTRDTFIPPSGPADTGGAAAIGDGELVPPAGFGAGGAAGLGSLLSDAQAGALQLANYATYYLMKGRSGFVGQLGLCPVLQRVRQQRPDIKLHLVGHSFGGRLVTSASATAAAANPPLGITSLTLLQAAFSHNGFARHFDGVRDGFFRNAITGHVVAGPILITFTPNDTAVGHLYPLASRLAGDDSANLGDAGDLYGGMGRNGAQNTPEASPADLLDIDGAYDIAGGTIYNLEGSPFISNHGDITGPQVAHALLSSISTT